RGIGHVDCVQREAQQRMQCARQVGVIRQSTRPERASVRIDGNEAVAFAVAEQRPEPSSHLSLSHPGQLLGPEEEQSMLLVELDELLDHGYRNVTREVEVDGSAER